MAGQPPHDVHVARRRSVMPLSMTCWREHRHQHPSAGAEEGQGDRGAQAVAELGADGHPAPHDGRGRPRACPRRRRGGGRPRRRPVRRGARRRSSRVEVTAPPSPRRGRRGRARRRAPSAGRWAARASSSAWVPWSTSRPRLEEQHLVGQGDGGRPVGDHERGGAAQLAPEGGEDARLGGGVDRRGGVVEQQQPGPAHQGTGQGEALALAARQGGAPLPHDGVAAAVEGGDEPRRRRPAPRAGSRCSAGQPRSTFSATVSAKRNASWKAVATSVRSSSTDRLASGRGRRARSSRNRGRAGRPGASSSVDLPQPVAPTTATVRPGSTVKLTSSSTARSGSWAKVSPRTSRRAPPAGRPARTADVDGRGGGRPARRGPAGCGRGPRRRGAARRARSR